MEDVKNMKNITDEMLQLFNYRLINEEKAQASINKYMHDVSQFKIWLHGREVTKDVVLAYKEFLCEKYAPSSVNATLSSLNSFFGFLKWFDFRVKNLKIQRQLFTSDNSELTKDEDNRMLDAAKRKKNERLFFLMQTICSTGIRVSELKYITVGAITCGIAKINGKGKRRQVILPNRLCHALQLYAKKKQIKSGAIFITKNGNPLDRSNIWSEMKKLCKDANVPEKKVYPHNLRHLFARTYYSLEKDIVRLADILGHSNVNTTRIYTIESGEVHRKQIQRLGLLRC